MGLSVLFILFFMGGSFIKDGVAISRAQQGFRNILRLYLFMSPQMPVLGFGKAPERVNGSRLPRGPRVSILAPVSPPLKNVNVRAKHVARLRFVETSRKCLSGSSSGSKKFSFEMTAGPRAERPSLPTLTFIVNAVNSLHIPAGETNHTEPARITKCPCLKL